MITLSLVAPVVKGQNEMKKWIGKNRAMQIAGIGSTDGAFPPQLPPGNANPMNVLTISAPAAKTSVFKRYLGVPRLILAAAGSAIVTRRHLPMY